MNLTEALGLVADSGAGFAVRATFERMEIAEDALASRGMSKREGAFMLLKPPVVLLGLDPKVYRSHCLELLDRISGGSPGLAELRRPTKAEVLAGMSRASLKAPPKATWCALQERLFVDVMGFRPAGESPREEWPGAMNELLGELERAHSGELSRDVPECFDAASPRAARRSRRRSGASSG